MNRKHVARALLPLALLSAGFAANGLPTHASPPAPLGVGRTSVMWINHLGLLAGDSSVQTSFDAVSSGVGGGLSGLVITSTEPDDTVPNGGNKVVETGLQVPPGYLIRRVRICYELSNPRSYISQIRLAQMQNPPSTASVLLDDATPQNATGPVCANSTPTLIDPSRGEVTLSLRTNFADTGDSIVVRSLGLILTN